MVQWILYFIIRNYSGGQNDGRTRKRGVCEVHFDPENLDNEEVKNQISVEKSDNTEIC